MAPCFRTQYFLTLVLVTVKICVTLGLPQGRRLLYHDNDGDCLPALLQY